MFSIKNEEKHINSAFVGESAKRKIRTQNSDAVSASADQYTKICNAINFTNFYSVDLVGSKFFETTGNKYVEKFEFNVSSNVEERIC